jgi:transposase
VPLACWAHARRKFTEALTDDHQRASTVLAAIQKLYAMEEQARAEQLDYTQRKELRLQKSLSIINDIGQYIYEERLNIALCKRPILTAFNYTISLFTELQNYLYEGRTEIDNNLIENAIRPVALGRKNYLFAGSHNGAHNIAMWQSFFGTCKLHNVNPQRWMKYVLDTIAITETKDYIKLLPQNIDPSLLTS